MPASFAGGVLRFRILEAIFKKIIANNRKSASRATDCHSCGGRAELADPILGETHVPSLIERSDEIGKIRHFLCQCGKSTWR
jgi:hypothetical protein